MHRMIRRLFPASLLGLVTALAAPVSAETGPGAIMKAASGSDTNCFNILSYGGVTNNCTTGRWLVGHLYVAPNAYHATSVSIYGNNGSNCQTVSINGVGNGAFLGPVRYVASGPKTWQLLNLGSTYVWEDSGLIFRCYLEAGGSIGAYYAP